MIIMMTMTIVPIVVTLLGIVTDVSAVQSWKAPPANNRNRVSKSQ